jgi:hypothetical protein
MMAANLSSSPSGLSPDFKPQKATGLNLLAAKMSFGGQHRADTYERLASLLKQVKLDVAIRALYDVASEGGKNPNEGKAVIFSHTMEAIRSTSRKLVTDLRRTRWGLISDVA